MANKKLPNSRSSTGRITSVILTYMDGAAASKRAKDKIHKRAYEEEKRVLKNAPKAPKKAFRKPLTRDKMPNAQSEWESGKKRGKTSL